MNNSPAGRLVVSGRAVVYAHTVLGYAAFLSALVVGIHLHYRRIVKNGVAGYPYEWWPSVSATIGDWFPERNLFQIIVAVTSGPRFLLVALCALQALNISVSRGASVFTVGVLRTLSCGGWMFVTSSDHGLAHDVGMAAYLVFTPIWMILCSTSLGGGDAVAHRRAQRLRAFAALIFYACVPFMIYYYIQHKVKRVPGAYSIYAIFEWTLVLMDVLFDHAASWDVSNFEVELSRRAGASVVDAKPSSAVGAGTVRSGGAGGGDAKIPHTEISSTESSCQKCAAVRTALSFVARIYLSFITWSAWAVLPSTIFYFSVSNMGVEGHELFIASQVIALGLLVATPLGRLLNVASFRKTWVQIALWYTVLFALPVYMSRAAPFPRLLCAAMSAGISTICSAFDAARAWENGTLVEHAVVSLLGLVALTVAKYWNHGNSPVWPYLDETNGGWQLLFFHIGVVAAVLLLWQPKVQAVNTRGAQSWGSFFVSAAALGAWLIETHTLLSDSGTMIVWGWAGYPVNGPIPVEHGAFIVAALAVSTLVALYRPGVFTRPFTFAINGAATFALLKFDGWPSFAGAVVIALTLPGMVVPLLHGAMRHSPIAVLFVTWLVYTVLEFLGVLTVAYAFLPGAHVMREHTGAMLLAQHVLIGAGILNARGVQAKVPQRLFRRVACIVTLALAGAAAFVPVFRHVPETSIAPHYPEDRVLTAGIWTVHFGFDQSMRDSSRRMADILKTLKMDMVGLLETDLHRPCFGNRDLTQYLAQELQMYVDIGPSPKKHTWGAVLLSKFPIINSTHHLLPSPHGELAPAIHAVVDIFGVHTHVIVSHNGQEEDRLDRTLQTTEVARILREAYPHPAIFLGYVVTKPHAPRPNPYKILFEDGRIHDVNPKDGDRWCQYLGFRGLERVGYARVSRYTVTDTELQTFKLRVPTEPIDPDRDVRPIHLHHNSAPNARWWYPRSLIKSGILLNETHKYAPYMYPQYFDAEPQQ
ncbi:Protein cwh43 [Malassezia cuniculi]|uniref:Protein cwh43 n=1 Tax=Malassezia cuniculi TaxID=948313 RepID=A0AAF0EXG2_9BASI|nr:Protein cwh43 [Malassezia cuniculi]